LRVIPPNRSNNLTGDSESDDPALIFQIFDRAAILASIGVDSELGDFEEFAEATQKSLSELFLNQVAVCLQSQTSFMERRRAVLDIDQFRILSILTGLMRQCTSFDLGVDINRSFEFLERQGYKISTAEEVENE
jgi:hypothetical protein